MKLLKLSQDMYEVYRKTVKGNEHTSLDQARRKLTRNVLLAKEVSSWLQKLIGKSIYLYGNLHIAVQFGKVVALENHYGNANGDWKLDKKEYIRLSKELGITDNKFAKKKKRK